MSFSTEEIENLERLLLSGDGDMMQLGIELLKRQCKREETPAHLMYVLNLGAFMHTQTARASELKNQYLALIGQSIAHETVQKAVGAKLQKAFQQQLELFRHSRYFSSEQEAWKAYQTFLPYEHIYLPIILRNATLHPALEHCVDRFIFSDETPNYHKAQIAPAQALANAALAVNPNNVKALQLRYETTQLAYSAGDECIRFEDLEADAQRLIALATEYNEHPHYSRLGVLYAFIAKDKSYQLKACEVFEKMLSLKGAAKQHNWWVRNNLACLYVQQKDPKLKKRALSHAKAAAKKMPDDADLQETLAHCYWVCNNEIAKALEHFANAIKLDPKHIIALSRYMQLLAQERQYTQLPKLLRALLQQSGNSKKWEEDQQEAVSLCINSLLLKQQQIDKAVGETAIDWTSCRVLIKDILPSMSPESQLQFRLHALADLGKYLLQDSEERQAVLRQAEAVNSWFTADNALRALTQIAENWLQFAALKKFVSPYEGEIYAQGSRKKESLVLVLAGNVPLVGLHDVLCAYLIGLPTQIKLSEKDAPLMRYCLNFLQKIDYKAAELLQIVEQAKQPITRVIATGSDNSALHFEQYFGRYPHIIRHNRNSVAILTGKETEAEIMRLGIDIFRFFGLGCRSVSKIMVPQNYDFQLFMRTLDNYRDIINHVKYCNNFEYNRSIYLINSVPHLANDCLMVLENASPLSRIATLHYEHYSTQKDLIDKLTRDTQYIQCSPVEDARLRRKLQKSIPRLPFLPFGTAQNPSLADFADNVDTMNFLLCPSPL